MAMDRLCRLSADQLMVLEDRRSDALASAAAQAGHHVIIAQTARAWIDLNRAEDEIDLGMIAFDDRASLTAKSSAPNPSAPSPIAPSLSAKVRGGLGLIPRRIAAGGELWREPLSASDVNARVASVYWPYHEAVAAALAARVERFGTAILLDLHTMPPLKTEGSAPAPHVVVGDLFRRSAHPRFTDRVLTEAQAAGFRTALNAPYAGGAILERHAKPHRNIHALQLEIDRRLYLDASMRDLSAGAAATAQLVRRIADALQEEALNQALPLAAE